VDKNHEVKDTAVDLTWKINELEDKIIQRDEEINRRNVEIKELKDKLEGFMQNKIAVISHVCLL
jgi:uncharacterized coiled-coil DUF342 family protein